MQEKPEKPREIRKISLGILDGVQMGIVYGLAILHDCGTEYGQKAHGKMCCNACLDDVFFINKQGVI